MNTKPALDLPFRTYIHSLAAGKAVAIIPPARIADSPADIVAMWMTAVLDRPLMARPQDDGSGSGSADLVGRQSPPQAAIRPSETAAIRTAAMAPRPTDELPGCLRLNPPPALSLQLRPMEFLYFASLLH
nr:hypothetical protein [Paraburkholderia sp. BL8N3]